MLEYIIGLGATQTLLLIWFYSPLKTTIVQLFFKKDAIDGEILDTWLLLKSPFIGKLFGCYFCCSFWLSLIVGIVFMLWSGLSWLYPVITWLTYPSITYLYKKILDL